MLPFRVKVKKEKNSLFLLQVPGKTLMGEPFYAMLLDCKVREGWMPALYDAKVYYENCIREMQGACTAEHLDCLTSTCAYLANLIWLADMEEMEAELNLA